MTSTLRQKTRSAIALLLGIGATLGLPGCKKKPPAPGGIVFFGASITQDWNLSSAFPGVPAVNRGVGGQYIEAMEKRFQRDVLDLKPRAVIMKPCAINFGPLAEGPELVKERLARMAEAATRAGIRVSLATIIPSTKAWAAKKDKEWPGEHKWEVQSGLLSVNEFIRKLAAEKGYPLIDYYEALKDNEGFADTSLFKDGLHPNDLGYQRMRDAAKPVVAELAAIPYPPK